MTVKTQTYEKIKRNDKCYCGSGKKYKQCCLNVLSGSAIKINTKLKALCDQYINGSTVPGIIVSYVDNLIHSISEQKITGVGKGKLIPDRYLDALNSQSSRPIVNNKKRKLQSTYPHIDGVYLLLRSMDILVISKKRELQVNNENKIIWYALNPAEKYINLLIYWLYKANPKLIKKHDSILDSAQYIISAIANKRNRENIYHLFFSRAKFNLALMELFGFFEIEEKEAQPNLGWEVEDIKLTKFGLGFLDFTMDELRKQSCFLEEIDYKKKFAEFAICIPSCNKLIEQKAVPHFRGTYILKIVLTNDIWRKIELSSECDFDDLAIAIINAFEFDNDHLYAFSIGDEYGNTHEISHPYCDSHCATTEVTLGEMGFEKGNAFHFVYDFGDNWRFTIQVESFFEEQRCDTVKVFEAVGESPDQYGG